LRILIVQNTDWIRRNPAQQHHLAEMLSLKGHIIRVIDYEILWRKEGKRELLSQRKVFNNVSKIHTSAKVTVIRPSIVKIPLIDYVSLMFSHKKEIDRQIREFNPDVIVSLGIVAYLAGRAAKKNKIPFVYYWIDVSHRLIPVKFLQPIGWMIERMNLKLADKIFVINKKLGYYVIRNGADPKKVVVLGAGIYLDKFDPNLNGSFIRERYGISENDIVLFFMGWLYKFSGLREVALKLLEVGIKNMKLLIVGDGDLYDELQEMKNRLDKNNSIILAGRRPYDEIPYYIAVADICILPAYTSEKIMHDIVPIKIYEYMAMGKPVISTKLPGVMLEFGMNNGIIFVDSPEDVVKMALHIIENNNLKELGDKARRSVEKYDWNYIASEFEDILKKVAEERRLP